MSAPIDLPADVLQTLANWLPSNEDRSRPAMTLATVGETGTPDVRTVLLAAYDARGFVFHTANLTRKVADLMANAKVALGFLLDDPVRQLTVQGEAVRQDADEAKAAFDQVSRYRQIQAWLNTNEFARLEHSARRDRWNEFAREHPEGTLNAPDGWVGYRVIPERLTFWTDSFDAGSQRVEYAQAGGGWVHTTLAG